MQVMTGKGWEGGRGKAENGEPEQEGREPERPLTGSRDPHVEQVHLPLGK